MMHKNRFFFPSRQSVRKQCFSFFKTILPYGIKGEKERERAREGERQRWGIRQGERESRDRGRESPGKGGGPSSRSSELTAGINTYIGI